MAWLPTIVSLGILLLCCGAFELCRRERLAIKRDLDDFKAGPPDAARDMAAALAERRSGERHWTAGGK
jgi:hypothetical protein